MDRKISFTFNKCNKKAQLVTKKGSPEVINKEFIKCLESYEIKLLEDVHVKAPLVIPLKGSHKTPQALASLIKRRAVLLGEDDNIHNTHNESYEKSQSVSTKPKGGETLEERATQEILDAIKANDATNTCSNLVLPVVHPDNLPLDGAEQSTLDDYERIPVAEFGKAMLRGMGWVDPPPDTVKKGEANDIPQIRPKGMGLGADKMLKPKPLLIPPEKNEVLEIKRNAFVRIIGGKYKDLYGQIEGFDDYAGRIIVKMAIGNNKATFNEFLCQPVSSNEYARYGKCINNSKYEDYKKREKNSQNSTVQGNSYKGEFSKEVMEEYKVKDLKIHKEKRVSNVDLNNGDDDKHTSPIDVLSDKEKVSKKALDHHHHQSRKLHKKRKVKKAVDNTVVRRLEKIKTAKRCITHLISLFP